MDRLLRGKLTETRTNSVETEKMFFKDWQLTIKVKGGIEVGIGFLCEEFSRRT